MDAGLNSRARAFVLAPNGEALQTQNELLSWVEDYSESSLLPPDTKRCSQIKAIGTNKPPINFQHSGHSVAIVGLGRWRDGSRSPLVFDPFFSPGDTIRNLAGACRLNSRLRPGAQFKVYRRKMHYLAKYKEFEVIASIFPVPPRAAYANDRQIGAVMTCMAAFFFRSSHFLRHVWRCIRIHFFGFGEKVRPQNHRDDEQVTAPQTLLTLASSPSRYELCCVIKVFVLLRRVVLITQSNPISLPSELELDERYVDKVICNGARKSNDKFGSVFAFRDSLFYC